MQAWILEESIAGKDQQWAPPGTYFHHVNLAKPLIQTRKDCTYASYPAMRVPRNIKGLRSCEVRILEYETKSMSTLQPSQH